MKTKQKNDTNIETLIKAFKLSNSLSRFVIQTMFPNASPAQMVWHLHNRHGMYIEKEKQGKEIMYRYMPDIPTPIIRGSKKKYKLSMMLNREVY